MRNAHLMSTVPPLEIRSLSLVSHIMDGAFVVVRSMPAAAVSFLVKLQLPCTTDFLTHEDFNIADRVPSARLFCYCLLIFLWPERNARNNSGTRPNPFPTHFTFLECISQHCAVSGIRTCGDTWLFIST